MLLQHVYIFILNNTFKITGSINEKARDALIVVCCLAFAGLYAFWPKPVSEHNRMVFGTTIMILMTVLSVNKKLEPVKWNKWIYIPYVAFGIGILVINCIHFVGEGYIIFALDLVLLFPAFYLVWINRGDYEKLYDIVAIAFAIAGLACFIYCIWLAYNGEYIIIGNRSAGGTKNPNYLGMIGFTTFVSSEYFILKGKGNKTISFLFASLAGLGLSMVVESVSRTAMLSVIFSIVVFIAFIIKNRHTEGFKTNIKVTIAISIVLLLTFFFLGLTVDDIQNKAELSIDNNIEADVELEALAFIPSEDHSVQATGHITVWDTAGIAKAESNKPVNSADDNKIIELSAGETASNQADANGNDVNNETGDTEEGHLDNFIDRLTPGEGIVNFSSGRLFIWSVYLSKLNLLGNDFNELTLHDFNGTQVCRAHNNILDYAYRCGIIVALSYIWVYLYSIIYSLILTFDKRHICNYSFLCASVIGVYALYSFIEVSTLAFTRVMPFLFFILIFPLFGKRLFER